ncbi:hypothetical protein Tco_1216105 [Tanacetum coccineum]
MQLRLLWESSSKTDERIDKLADQISTLVEIGTNKVVTPTTVKVLRNLCYLCDSHVIISAVLINVVCKTNPRWAKRSPQLAGLGYGDQMNKGVLSYENEVFQSVFVSRTSDIEDSLVNDRYAEGMHAVPLPMTGIYIPSGPDKEIDDS